MKKLSILFLLSICCFLFANASNWVGINSNNPEKAKITLVSSDIANNIVTFSLSGFTKNAVITPKGDASTITVGEGTHILMKDAPDLAKLTTSIIIPDKGNCTIEVLTSKYTEYTNINVAPSKGNLTRDIDPATVPYVYGKIYEKNEFFPGKLADLKEPYIIRDYRGQTIVVYPFQYNPVTKVLRVYTEITVKVVNNEKISGINEFIRASAPTKIDNDYENIYKHQFINYANQKYTPLGEQGKMLIICYGSFMTAMQPFVDWKNTIGIPTEIVNVTTAGATAAAIKTYVQNYYTANGLTYLLLVGDAAQIPTFTVSGGGSDNTYGYFTGNDHYQEILVGRFSAENTTHVTTQVNRTINYEQNPSTTANKFNKVIGIGSDQGPGDDNEYDYQHNRNMNIDLLAFTYIAPTIELYDGSQGGNDAAGNPTPTMVGNEINNGAGIINYTGHGSDNSWGTSGFSNTNIASLTNTEIQPFIWSVACVNGNFVSGTCFAEGWLRATYNGQPSGSIATFMSTINQSWNPPMEGQDEMNDILCEHYPTNIKRTFGGLSINGCFKMNDTYSDWAMTDTWTVFGDPSVMVRTANPGSLSITHAANAIIGSTQFVVNCPTENAFVALTINNQIIGTGYIVGGSATITFPALLSVGTLKIAVTAFNKIPCIHTVPIIAPSGPYLSFGNIVINDPTGNNNHLADFAENITLDVTLQNVGPDAANTVTSTLTTTDTYVNISDNSQAFGNIAGNSSGTQVNAYGISIANNIPDAHVVSFSITAQDNASHTWTMPFNINVNAPIMSIGNIIISDPLPGGNNNGRMDPDETVTVTIPSSNTGHANSTGAVGTLTCVSPLYHHQWWWS